jgi:hypothetical protein
MIETISGITAAVAIIIISRVLSGYFTLRLMATTILVAIAFIYVGFSLKDNPVGLIVLEVVIALLLYFMAMIGYTRNSLLIAYGIILHGVWDICHHNNALIGTDVPVYWPSFCFVIDIIDGLYFLIIFKTQKNSATRSSASDSAGD